MKLLLRYIFVLLYCVFGYASSEASDIREGQVSLSLSDLCPGTVSLKGESFFYQQKLFDMKDITCDTSEVSFLTIGHSWNYQLEDYVKRHGSGYGTYYFTINIPQELVGEMFMLRPENYITSASKIFVNGKPCGGNGQVGRAFDDPLYAPSRNVKVASFTADTSVLHVVIQCSNYHKAKGGILHPLTFGLEKYVVRARQRMITIDIFIIISLFVMSCYHFVSYAFNRDKLEVLYYSILCMLLAIDLSFRGSVTFFVLFPNLPFSFYSQVHMIVPFFSPAVFYLFLNTLFRRSVPKFIIKISFIGGLLCTAIALWADTSISSQIVLPFFSISALGVFHCLIIAYQQMRKKAYGSRLFFYSYSVFVLCILNDVLDMYEIIRTMNLISFGMLFLSFFIAISYGQRREHLHKELLLATKKIEQKKVELEDKVVLRNKELQHSMDDLNKLSTFQEGVTNLIASDLKQSLKPLLHIEDVHPRDYQELKYIGFNMLNTIHNMLDIYRYNNDRVTIRRSRFIVLKLINSTISELSYLIQKKEITLEIFQEHNYALNADGAIFKQVILNLLTNCLYHAPSNSLVQIRLSIHAETSLCVSVSNQGPPLTDLQKEKIFGSILPEDNSSGLEEQKSLFSLYSCKLAIEAHGGSIGIDPDDTKGTTLWFALAGVSVADQDTRAEKLALLLTVTDRECLRPFLEQMSSLKIYDLSRIEAIIIQIPKSTEGLELWCSCLNDACYQLDEEAYKSLLRIA